MVASCTRHSGHSSSVNGDDEIMHTCVGRAWSELRPHCAAYHLQGVRVLDWSTLSGHFGAVGIGLAGGVLLRAFYSAFASEWPGKYFGNTSTGAVDPVISRTPWRYLVFRLGPVFLVAVAAGVTADRLGAPRSTALVATVAAHALSGLVPAAFTAITATPRRLGLAAYHLIALGGCVVVAFVGLAIGGRGDRYFPTGVEVAYGFWVALAVFAVGHLGRSLTGKAPKDEALLARARAEVPTHLILPLVNAKSGHPLALVAIAYAEHLNRPQWVRRLERTVGIRGGTYGIMQVRAPRPITDSDSVEMFLQRLPGYPPLSAEPSWDELRTFFLHHNDDSAFADLAMNLYWLMHHEFTETNPSLFEGPESSSVAPTSLPALAVAAGIAVGAWWLGRRR